MKPIVVCLVLGSLFGFITPIAAAQEDSRPIISLLVDVDMPASPTENDIRSAEVNLNTLYAEIVRHKGTATLSLTKHVSSSRIRLLLAQFTVMYGCEFAVSSNNSEDKLSTMSLSEQEALITSSIETAEAARVCGKSVVNVMGFMPPGFDQNEDTYEVMDNLEFTYNSGFQSGIIYAPGHEGDVWPYQVEGYNFFAVPISSASVDEELMPLYDKMVADQGIGATEWAEILKAKLDEASANDEPTVILLSTSVSGTGEHLNALKEFLDYAVSKKATFVNAAVLVEMAKTGSLTPPEVVPSECLTCGEDELNNVTIVQVEHPDVANETAENATEEIEA